MSPVDPVNRAALEFTKDGCRLGISCYDTGDGKTSVMVHHAGSFDMRKAPKFEAAPSEFSYESPDTVIYRTKADLLSIETALLKAFHAAGWAGYSRLKTSHSETPDQRDLDFVEHAGRYLGKLKADGHIESFRIMRRKLGLGIPGLGEFHIAIETFHHAVNSRVENFKAALYRDFPDPQRRRGEEKF